MEQTTLSRFGMDTATLAGPLAAKLAAARAAGFTQAMVWAKDLVAHPDGLAAAADCVRASGLRPTGLQLLRDFEGTRGSLRAHKRAAAESALEVCRAVGAPMLLVSSSTSAHADGAADAIARDLAGLAELAAPDGVRIGYEALSWARHVRDVRQAWDVVARAGHPNLGVVVDAFHLLAGGTPFAALDAIPPERIALVQLCDFMWDAVGSDEEAIDTARHQRVFPGEGAHTEALHDLVRRLHANGYAGDYSFEVLADDFLQMPLERVAGRAHTAARRLADVLR